MVRQEPLPGEPRLVAGCDVSFNRFDKIGYAAAVLMNAADFSILENVSAEAEMPFPYVPGCLAFREMPPLEAALRKLRRRPGLVLCDGQGRAHPRRFGIACHLGLALDVPTIGCAKSILTGRPAGAMPEAKGSWVELREEGETVGALLRSREGTAPLVVSVGHLVTLEDALWWALRLCRGFRVPEPLRAAHALANEARRAAAKPH
jgi:deoxyribonuclease V